MNTSRNLLLAIFVSTLSAAPSHARSWDEIKSAGSIRFATEGTFPPFNEFKGKDLTGFEVEVANEIAHVSGIKYEWKTYPFDSLLIGLGQNRYDLVAASHGVTDERAKAVDFTNPHYCTGGVIFSRTGGPKTEADLKGKVVAVQVGTSYLTHLKDVPGVKDVKTYPRDTDSLQNLMAGRADAWVTDKFVGLEAMHNNPGKIQMGDMLFQERVAMAVSKGNAGLRDQINKGLAEILKNGKYAEISKKYFKQDIRCK